MKKLLLFFGLISMINLTFAQDMVTIHQNGHEMQVSAVRSVTDFPASDIQFWVGRAKCVSKAAAPAPTECVTRYILILPSPPDLSEIANV